MPPDQPAPQGRPHGTDQAPPGDNEAWLVLVPPAAAEPVIAVTPVVRPAPPAPRRRWLDDVLGAEEAAEFRSIPARIAAWLDDLVRRGQPFTASLCVHTLALILLALMFVRVGRDRRQPIDLSFATARPVKADQPGVQIVKPQTVPEPENQPEVPVEKQAVANPSAARTNDDGDRAAAPGPAPGPTAAPAVGALLDGREEGRREALVAKYGGSEDTEIAVARALDWIVRQQRKDGLWSLQGPYLDRASQENKVAATAMALLALQGAGNTTLAGKHQQAVEKAWKALLKWQVAGGDGESIDQQRRSGSGSFVISPNDPPARQGLYAHAQATIALCELYGMTKNVAYEQPARRAVAYAVAAQGPNGGWRYEPGQDGDMSVTGWFMMALKSAQMAGIDVPAETFASLTRFLDTVAVDGGRRYGYQHDGISRAVVDEADGRVVMTQVYKISDAVSAEGLLCRQYLGWPREHPALGAGAKILLRDKFVAWDSDKDVYAWYYITQVVHHLGGPAWTTWNARMKEVLPAAQVANGTEAGSWDPAGDQWGPWGGRLFTTCFCTYMLEVYYRHLPLYGAEAVVAAP
ncbi:MAG: squalene--hopene cyclase [Planctomycetaceae bacterium]